MKYLTIGSIVAGVIVAVIAAVAVEWFKRLADGSGTSNLTDSSSWNRVIGGGPGGYIYGSGVSPSCGWQENNLNSQPSVFGPSVFTFPRSASAYQNGAPVSNFRDYVKIGSMTVPSG